MYLRCLYHSQKGLQLQRNDWIFFKIHFTLKKNYKHRCSIINNYISRRSSYLFYVSYLVEDYDARFIALNLLKSIFCIRFLKLLHTIVERVWSQRLIWFSVKSAGASRRSCRLPIVVAMCMHRAFPAAVSTTEAELFGQSCLHFSPTVLLQSWTGFSLAQHFQTDFRPTVYFNFLAFFFQNVWRSHGFCDLRRAFKGCRYTASR